jgi:hypothetical protein
MLCLGVGRYVGHPALQSSMQRGRPHVHELDQRDDVVLLADVLLLVGCIILPASVNMFVRRTLLPVTSCCAQLTITGTGSLKTTAGSQRLPPMSTTCAAGSNVLNTMGRLGWSFSAVTKLKMNLAIQRNAARPPRGRLRLAPSKNHPVPLYS